MSLSDGIGDGNCCVLRTLPKLSATCAVVGNGFFSVCPSFMPEYQDPSSGYSKLPKFTDLLVRTTKRIKRGHYDVNEDAFDLESIEEFEWTIETKIRIDTFNGHIDLISSVQLEGGTRPPAGASEYDAIECHFAPFPADTTPVPAFWEPRYTGGLDAPYMSKQMTGRFGIWTDCTLENFPMLRAEPQTIPQSLPGTNPSRTYWQRKAGIRAWESGLEPWMYAAGYRLYYEQWVTVESQLLNEISQSPATVGSFEWMCARAFNNLSFGRLLAEYDADNTFRIYGTVLNGPGSYAIGETKYFWKPSGGYDVFTYGIANPQEYYWALEGTQPDLSVLNPGAFSGTVQDIGFGRSSIPSQGDADAVFAYIFTGGQNVAVSAYTMGSSPQDFHEALDMDGNALEVYRNKTLFIGAISIVPQTPATAYYSRNQHWSDNDISWYNPMDSEVNTQLPVNLRTTLNVGLQGFQGNHETIVTVIQGTAP